MIALNVLGILLAAIIVFCGSMLHGFKGPSPTPSRSDIEERLETHIGKPYTSKLHSNFTKMIEANEGFVESTLDTVRAYGRIGTDIGVAFLAVFAGNLFIATRAFTKKKNAEQAGASDGDNAPN